MFAYCDNNPIIREDGSGYFWEEIGIALAITGAVVAVAVVYAESDNIEASVAYSKSKTNQRDSGLIGVPNSEIDSRLKDPSTSKQEKKRLEKEQKARGERNKSKRSRNNRSK